MLRLLILGVALWSANGIVCGQGSNESQEASLPIIKSEQTIEPLVEPPCSYCIEQNDKGFIQPDDRVLAWIRGAQNGGAFPLDRFITTSRVINDTYGLFFYDPAGGYVSAFEKDYGFEFYGWRNGVMVVKGPDGSLWSALSGRALAGPSAGKTMNRVPSMLTSWQHWMYLHPESTAYNLFDDRRYPQKKLSWDMEAEASDTITVQDPRLERLQRVIGLEGNESQIAFSLEGLADREVLSSTLDDKSVVVFWYKPTDSVAAFLAEVDGKTLTFYPDTISPGTAPFKDRETGTRWSLAGRGIDGPLRGKELQWVPSIQCRWYAWSTEYPETKLVGHEDSDAKADQ
ncbi:MAG: DUF3179 domain-containing (seleno)protein [Pirellulaceae bacterium]